PPASRAEYAVSTGKLQVLRPERSDAGPVTFWPGHPRAPAPDSLHNYQPCPERIAQTRAAVLMCGSAGRNCRMFKPTLGASTLLDRQTHKRSDAAYLEALLAAPEARFLVLADQKPVIR